MSHPSLSLCRAAKALLTLTLLAAGLSLPASGHADPKQAPPPQSAPASAPMIRDEGGYWSEAERAKMSETIQDLFRRYRCQVIVESHPKEPSAWANGADLDDPAALDRALAAVRDERFHQVRLHDQQCPCVVIIGGPGRYSYSVGFPNLTREEQGRLLGGIKDQVGNSLSRGLPDVLTYIGGTLQRKGADAKPTGSIPMPVPNPRPARQEQTAPGGGDGTSVEDMLGFKRAARDAGLSNEDVNGLLADRGPASYKDLTDFLKDQVKDGRRGANLKKDLQTFIRIFKEKSGG